MKKLLSLLILASFLFASAPAFADVTGYNNGTALGRGEEVNFANGLAATKSGEKFTIGILGVSAGYVSQVSSTAALPLGYRVVGIPLSNAAGAVYTLANGTYVGQIIHFFAFGQSGSDSAVITPATATGFVTATLSHNQATVTLEWTSVGWVVDSYDNNTVS
jgi:hypothetical protein